MKVGRKMNIGYSVNYCSKLLKNRLNKELETEDITVAQFAVIKYIEMNSLEDQQDRNITAVEIAEGLDMDKPTISGIINRLVDKGYVIKLPHAKDKRASILKLTEYCIEKLPNLEAINEIVINSALKELSNEDLYVFQNIIYKIIQNLQ
ncbi:MarR family winged helix-turn-helix transcriptional regulator [Acetoanaerobium noterae]|uniref:MarR family winged helix-turn-helix transcriptional regulator n=1 Tax=Acetoanaerobium noterae TaxID=745369 RepID=UPI003221CE14